MKVGVCLYAGTEYSLGAIICEGQISLRCEVQRNQAERQKLSPEALQKYEMQLPPGSVIDVGYWSIMSDPIAACRGE